MKRFPWYLMVVFVVVVLLLPQSATAQDDASPTVGMQDGRYSVGFATSWPSYGLSGTLHVSDALTGEVIAGFFGTVSNFGGRAWYRFNRNEAHDLYAYAGASLHRYNFLNNSENVLGIGGGAGVEVSMRKILDNDDFPPIFWTAELGLAYADFDVFDGFSTMTFGSGIRYRFGAR